MLSAALQGYWLYLLLHPVPERALSPSHGGKSISTGLWQVEGISTLFDEISRLGSKFARI
jgi:hypothetical protein